MKKNKIYWHQKLLFAMVITLFWMSVTERIDWYNSSFDYYFGIDLHQGMLFLLGILLITGGWMIIESYMKKY